VKSLMSLWSCAASELAVRCSTSAIRDIKYATSRYEHEGLSFLAITLADYGKALERSLDRGLVDPWDFTAFKSCRLTGFPLFLGGFLDRVFDRSSGVILDDPDIEAIYALRQLTLMFSKIALPGNTRQGAPSRNVVSPARERLAMLEYVQCEQEVRDNDAFLDPQYQRDFRRVSELLYGELFSKLDRDVYWGRVIPRHGPGAVADKLTSNGKWNQRTWTTRLERYFPHQEFLYANQRSREQRNANGVTLLEPGSEMPVRVITVPKTLKSPRIIAIEPTCMQYVQQGILRCFLDAFKEDGFLSRVIGFDDQEPNRLMAMKGSLSGELATLDLSEASDRVSNQHVCAMLDGYPDLLGAVQSSRSQKADVPGHGVIRLAKYASMGSALCFPMEAMVFLTVIFLGIERELNTPLCRESLLRYRDRVRVFGDDLIVPREYVLSVVNELSVFGHKVNVSKSFWTGRYRESCGREFFDGHDVSIVKVREELPTRRQDASGVIASVSLRNRLYWAGLWRCAAWMDDYLEKLLTHFPNVAPSSPLLGRESALGYQFERLDPNYHSPLTKGYRVVAKPPSDFLEGDGALLKCLSGASFHRSVSMNGGGPGLPPSKGAGPGSMAHLDVANVDDEHLERSGRPEHVSIKLGWGSPF
jgi:hypothetical protein